MSGKIDVVDHVAAFIGIAEVHVAEGDFTLLPRFAFGAAAVDDGRLGVGDFENTLGGDRGSRVDHVNHDEEHEGHDDLHRVRREDHHVGEQRDLVGHGGVVDHHRAEGVDREGQSV